MYIHWKAIQSIESTQNLNFNFKRYSTEHVYKPKFVTVDHSVQSIVTNVMVNEIKEDDLLNLISN